MMYISVITWFFFYDLEHVDIVDHYYCDLVFFFFVFFFQWVYPRLKPFYGV